MVNNQKEFYQLKQDVKSLLISNGCILNQVDFNLSSGLKSTFYFDCKRAMLNGDFLDKVSDLFMSLITELPLKPSAIGGMTMGADFLTSALILKYSQLHLPCIRGSIVRKEPKKYGTGVFIENELPVGTRIVIVDDVITTGKSILKVAEQFINAGYHIVGVLGLIDRELGGVESISEKLQCPVQCLFLKSDFLEIIT